MTTEPQDVPCNELVELVTDYLEGALSFDERTRFEAHLAICEGCSNYLAQMWSTIRIAGRLTEESIPPETLGALAEAFRDFSRT